jgi:hypothetical protein
MVLSFSLIYLFAASIGSCVNPTGIGEDTTQTQTFRRDTEQPIAQQQRGPQQGSQQLPHIIQPPLQQHHLQQTVLQFSQNPQLSPYIPHQYEPQHLQQFHHQPQHDTQSQHSSQTTNYSPYHYQDLNYLNAFYPSSPYYQHAGLSTLDHSDFGPSNSSHATGMGTSIHA